MKKKSCARCKAKIGYLKSQQEIYEELVRSHTNEYKVFNGATRWLILAEFLKETVELFEADEKKKVA